MKTVQVFCALLLCSVSGAHAACPVGNSEAGVVKGTPIGIEYMSACTFVLMGSDMTTTLPDHDDGGFAAGRFKYLAIDPAVPEDYKVMLSIALTAIASGTRVYARVVGRYAKVTTLSMSSEQNNLP